MTPPLSAPLALVCHDVGAAQLILPWLPPDAAGVRAHLQGPARELWIQRFGSSDALLPHLEQALDGAQWLLSGTSLRSDLEHRARVEAALRGQRTVAVIDHWVHYEARFQRDGLRVLPDEIWVCDAEAYALAQAGFPGHDIRLQPNAWLREQVERIAPCPDPRTHPTVLVLNEALHEPWCAELSCPEQALNFLIEQASCLGLQAPLSLRIRLHDGEARERWDTWMRTHRGVHDIAIDRSATLAEALDGVAWVAGLESPALVIALATGRRAVCLQPPWAPRSRLPQRGLIHLRDLIRAS
ncbi:MAG: hypothetical protein U1F56_05695 [Rubrivivax sp.]